MVQYTNFKFIEGRMITYESEYEFVKRDCASIVLIAYPLIFICNQSLVKDIFTNKSRSSPLYIWIHSIVWNILIVLLGRIRHNHHNWDMLWKNAGTGTGNKQTSSNTHYFINPKKVERKQKDDVELSNWKEKGTKHARLMPTNKVIWTWSNTWTKMLPKNNDKRRIKTLFCQSITYKKIKWHFKNPFYPTRALRIIWSLRTTIE